MSNTSQDDTGHTVSESILKEAEETLQNGANAETHQAKIVALSDLMSTTFGVDLDEILPGIEQRLDSKLLGVTGRLDLFFKGLVLEMKTDFDDEYDDAIDKLQDSYFPLLLEEDPDETYVGLITDMKKFELVRPVLDDGEVVDVAPIDRINTQQNSIRQVIFWLDSALFSGKVQTPSADELERKFGPSSPTYEIAVEELKELWQQAREKESAQLRLDLWTRMMEIVYGSSPDEEAFVAQTYLSVLVKLLVKLRLDPSTLDTKQEFVDIMDGEYFDNHGLTNLIEEDFFAWMLTEDIRSEAFEISKKLASGLNVYDVSKAEEDLFKEVYQDIVSIHQRHGTGEYYTPRWLCEFTLQEALEDYGSDPQDFPRMLDPACGSGGFLTAGVYELLDRSEDLPKEEQLELVLENIQGIDVNPLAVIIARANYAIALGDLINIGSQVTIPIFAADSIKLPELQASLHAGIRCYSIEIEGRNLMIPETIANDTEDRMSVLNALGQASNHYRDGLSQSQAESYLERRLPDGISSNEKSVLFETFKDLLQFVDANKDHIWVYVLNNFYAPILLKEDSDDPIELLIGNPPWIAMRSINNESYQNFLKSEIQEYNLLDKSDIKLYTHMEMATLFFRKAPDIYLGEGKRIAFIMPVSVTTGALHHKKFNEFDNPVMQLEEVHSFRGVRNIFSLPPCILISKLGTESEFPVDLFEWNGSLKGLSRNADWDTVKNVIESSDGEYSPAKIPTDESPYYDADGLQEGATLNPRNLFYIEPVKKGELGVNQSTPLVKTDSESAKYAGKKWKHIIIERQVESEFLHASLLGKDLIPFGHLSPRPVVLPSLTEGGDRLLLDETALRNRGYPLMAEWLEEAEAHWAENRTDKSEEQFPSVKDRIDYHSYFTSQDPEKQFVVIYNGRGANSYPTVINREDPLNLEVNGTTIQLSDLIADSTNYIYQTNNHDEAHYLCAVLNSHEIHEAVKPFQPEGAYGHRDIYRRPFKLPIPEFDEDNAGHVRLAELSIEAHEIVESIDFTDEGFKTRRRIATETLEEEGILPEINDLVLSLGMTGAVTVDE